MDDITHDIGGLWRATEMKGGPDKAGQPSAPPSMV
jgi:hypothetical protein